MRVAIRRNHSRAIMSRRGGHASFDDESRTVGARTSVRHRHLARALLVGIAGISLLDRFCPPDLMVSGACTATWHAPAVEGLVPLRTAMVSAGIVLVPAYVAPARRFLVAALAFGCGAAFALYAASDGDLWGPLFVAGVTGSASLWFLASKWRIRGIAARSISNWKK